MRRAIRSTILLLVFGWLAMGCSTPVPSASPTVAPKPRGTPAAYGPWPVDVTRSPSSPTRGVTTAIPSSVTPAPTATPVEVRLDADAQRAREHVLALSDLPPGFVSERIRVVTNEDAAAEEPNPSEVLAGYAEWGRITGFEAAYSRVGLAAQSGLAAVESVASVYATPEGAHASLEDFRAGSAREGAAAVSMPDLGDESLAVAINQTATLGSARASWVVYAIRIRQADLLISVNGYGLTGSLGFDEVLDLARVVLSQPRKSLPIPQPTATPAPSPVAQATPTPTQALGEADLEVQSYRAYRAPVGSAVIVVGEARNRGNGPAARVQIAVSLVDGEGKVIAAGSVNAAQLSTVPPGGRYPFRVMVDRVSRDWSEVRIQIQPLSDEGAPARYTALQAEGVNVVPPAQSAEGYGLAGDVVNGGSSSARGVRVVAVAYDGQGRVLDVAVTTPKLDPIAPGGRAPFALVWDGVLTAPPYRYELFLDAQPG